jgi:hypothetical protein
MATSQDHTGQPIDMRFKRIHNLPPAIEDNQPVILKQLKDHINEGGGGTDSTNPIKVKTNVIDFYNSGNPQLINFFFPEVGKGRFIVLRVILEMYSSDPENSALIKIGNNITINNVILLADTQPGVVNFPYLVNLSRSADYLSVVNTADDGLMIKIGVDPNTLTASITGKIYMEGYYENDYIVL